MGRKTIVKSLQFPLGETIKRKKDKRTAWIPVQIQGNKAYRADYNGSGHINALGGALGIISFPMGVRVMEEGQLVELRMI